MISDKLNWAGVFIGEKEGVFIRVVMGWDTHLKRGCWWGWADTCHDEPDRPCPCPTSLFYSLLHTWLSPFFGHQLRWQSRRAHLFKRFLFFFGCLFFVKHNINKYSGFGGKEGRNGISG